MYDVVHLGSSRGSRVLACGVAREEAARLARDEARRRRTGRMFLAGSSHVPTGELLAIVATGSAPII